MHYKRRSCSGWCYAYIPAGFYSQKIERKIKQNPERRVSASQGLVRRAALGAGLFHGSAGNGQDVVEKNISAHNTYEYNRE